MKYTVAALIVSAAVTASGCGSAAVAPRPLHAEQNIRSSLDQAGCRLPCVRNEYPIPSGGTPFDITSGPDGNLWFTESGVKVGSITPAGAIVEYATKSQPWRITSGPDGNLWYTAGVFAHPAAIGKITTSGRIEEFALPWSCYYSICYYDSAGAITSGPDGNLWLTETEIKCINKSCYPYTFVWDAISKMTTHGKILASYRISPTAGAEDITSGAGGYLWFTEMRANKIAKISTTGAITEYPLSTPSAEPYRISPGAYRTMWFTELTAGKVGRSSTGGNIIEYDVPTPHSGPDGITLGSDGHMWFAESNGNKIGRIGRQGTIVEVPVPTGRSQPTAVIRGRDGNIWFTEQSGLKIGKLVP